MISAPFTPGRPPMLASPLGRLNSSVIGVAPFPFFTDPIPHDRQRATEARTVSCIIIGPSVSMPLTDDLIVDGVQSE
jgi:hypothetical protein